jgi:hypothetical protein
MKRALGVMLTAALCLAVTGAVMAAEDKTPKPIEIKDKITIKATVMAIDTTHRIVTLKGPKGEMVTMPVDKDVPHFDNLKVGDQVTARYLEQVVVEVHKPGDAQPTESASVAVAPLPGSKPAEIASAQVTMTVKVLAVDPSIPAVTVQTSDGGTLSFRVSKKKYLKDLVAGDQVVITRTDALMVEVEPAK